VVRLLDYLAMTIAWCLRSSESEYRCKSINRPAVCNCSYL